MVIFSTTLINGSTCNSGIGFCNPNIPFISSTSTTTTFNNNTNVNSSTYLDGLNITQVQNHSLLNTLQGGTTNQRYHLNLSIFNIVNLLPTTLNTFWTTTNNQFGLSGFKAGDINFGDTINRTSLHVDQRYLADANASVSLNWNLRQLITPNGLQNLNWLNESGVHMPLREQVGGTNPIWDATAKHIGGNPLFTCNGTILACSDLSIEQNVCPSVSGCEIGACQGISPDDLTCSTYDESTCATKVPYCATNYNNYCGGTLNCGVLSENECENLPYSTGCTPQYTPYSCVDNPTLDCSTMNEFQCDQYTNGCTAIDNVYSSCDGIALQCQGSPNPTSNFPTSALCYAQMSCTPSFLGDCSIESYPDCTALEGCSDEGSYCSGAYYSDCTGSVTSCSISNFGYDYTCNAQNGCYATYSFGSCSTTGSCSSESYSNCPASFGCKQEEGGMYNGCANTGDCTSWSYGSCPSYVGCYDQSDWSICNNNVPSCSSIPTSANCSNFNYCETNNSICGGSILNGNCNQIGYENCTLLNTNNRCSQEIHNDLPTHVDMASVGQTADLYQARDSSNNTLCSINIFGNLDCKTISTGTITVNTPSPDLGQCVKPFGQGHFDALFTYSLNGQCGTQDILLANSIRPNSPSINLGDASNRFGNGFFNTINVNGTTTLKNTNISGNLNTNYTRVRNNLSVDYNIYVNGSRNFLTMRPQLYAGRIQNPATPTFITYGAYAGYSMPESVPADNEDLYFREHIPGRRMEGSNFTIFMDVAVLDAQIVGRNFTFAFQWKNNNMTSGVLDTTNSQLNITQSMIAGRNLSYSVYRLTFPTDTSSIKNGELFGGHLWRMEGEGTDITGEVMLVDVYITYQVDKVYKEEQV
jgi:hypothetical protein